MKNKIKQLIKMSWLAICYSWQVLSRTSSSANRIIVFHDIQDKGLFRERMQWLKNNYQVVSLSRLLSENGNNQIAITFDDGYANWITNALPILQELNIPATFFVCSGLIDLTGDEADSFIKNKLKRRQSLDLISSQQVQLLADNNLFEIGSHTVNHVDLGQSNSNNLWQTEILRDKQNLENLISKEVRWFAYPFGEKKNIDKLSGEFLKKIGFKNSFSFVLGVIDKDQNSFMIPRTGLSLTDPIWTWSPIINGYWDWTKK